MAEQPSKPSSTPDKGRPVAGSSRPAEAAPSSVESGAWPDLRRFTEQGPGSVERDVEELLGQLLRRVADAPGLDAVLLGGSLGHGEGTVRNADGRPGLTSDVELYLVGPERSLRSLATALEREFSEWHVSAAWLHPGMLRRGRAKNLSWRPSPTIRLYEIEAGSRVLAGRRPVQRAIRPGDLPLADGVRTLLNRLAEAAPEVASGTPDAARWLDKVLIGCGDALLLASGGYTVSYRERATRLGAIQPAWSMPEGWRLAVVAAYERKLDTQDARTTDLALLDAIAVATLRGAIPATAGVSLDPLMDFPQRFTTSAAHDVAYLRYLPPFGPAATYEGVVLVVRSWRAGLGPTPRGVRQALLGRPLSLALQSTALPLFLGVLRRDGGLLDVARRALLWSGLRAEDVLSAVDATQLANLLLRHWRLST